MLKFIVILLTSLLFVSCTFNSPLNKKTSVFNKIVIVDNSIINCADSYNAKTNDSLAHIARICSMSVMELADINQLKPPYKLKVAQKIYFKRQNTITDINSNTNSSGNYGRLISRLPKHVSDNKSWTKPVNAKIKQKFNPKANNFGISYQTKPGQSVYAVANGVVVYSNDKLPTHGSMVIIKHANYFYSAYTNNSKSLVRQGDNVNIGEAIAITSTKPMRLEMRQRSKNINPTTYINH